MIIEANRNFDPHPVTKDTIRAVIVDITEPKETNTQFGKKMKFAIVFETEIKKDDGTPWVHWDHGYTPSVDPKSTLCKNVKRILGIDEMPVPFDTETLIGKPARIIIEHNTSDGKTYANISFYGPETSDQPLKPSGKYVRQRDKQKTEQRASYSKAEAAPEENEPWGKTKVHVGQFAGQHLENLDEKAVRALIQHWLPKVTGPDAKPTADDRRLITALGEAQKVLDAPVEVNF